MTFHSFSFRMLILNVAVNTAPSFDRSPAYSALVTAKSVGGGGVSGFFCWMLQRSSVLNSCQGIRSFALPTFSIFTPSRSWTSSQESVKVPASRAFRSSSERPVTALNFSHERVTLLAPSAGAAGAFGFGAAACAEALTRTATARAASIIQFRVLIARLLATCNRLTVPLYRSHREASSRT